MFLVGSWQFVACLFVGARSFSVGPAPRQLAIIAFSSCEVAAGSRCAAWWPQCTLPSISTVLRFADAVKILIIGLVVYVITEMRSVVVLPDSAGI